MMPFLKGELLPINGDATLGLHSLHYCLSPRHLTSYNAILSNTYYFGTPNKNWTICLTNHKFLRNTI